MKTGRPPKGEKRESEHTRLPTPFKRKCQKIAEHRGVPVGDVIEKFSGKRVDREYARIVALESVDLGGES
jgi:hypothetical protein